MYCIASRRVLPALSEEERQSLLTQAHLHSLVEMLGAIPDPRGKHGLRYDLPYLLSCLLVALCCNCQSPEAVSQWCLEHVNLLQGLFGPRLFFTPSGSLYRWLLPQIDVEAVEQVFVTWIRATSLASTTDPLAVDGKTARGARTKERGAPHLLSCFTHQSQEVWAQLAVGEKPTRSRRHAHCFLPCPFMVGSVPLMRSTPIVSSGIRCVLIMPIHSLSSKGMNQYCKLISPRILPIPMPVVSRPKRLIDIEDALSVESFT
jgi:hypothetical protein